MQLEDAICALMAVKVIEIGGKKWRLLHAMPMMGYGDAASAMIIRL